MNKIYWPSLVLLASGAAAQAGEVKCLLNPRGPIAREELLILEERGHVIHFRTVEIGRRISMVGKLLDIIGMEMAGPRTTVRFGASPGLTITYDRSKQGRVQGYDEPFPMHGALLEEGLAAVEGGCVLAEQPSS